MIKIMDLSLIIDALVAIVITMIVIKMYRMHVGLAEIMQYILYKEELKSLRKYNKKIDERMKKK